MVQDLMLEEKYGKMGLSIQRRISKGAISLYLAELYLSIDVSMNALRKADHVISTTVYNLDNEISGGRPEQPGLAFMDLFFERNTFRNEGNTEALWVFPYDQFAQGGGVAHKNRNPACRYSEIVIDGVVPPQNTFERGGRGASIESLTNFCLPL